MRWRVTGSYLLSIVIAIMLVIVLNIIVFVIMLFTHATHATHATHDAPILKIIESNKEQFTREFAQHVIMSQGQVSISEEGKQLLAANNAWIQVLQENGEEVYSYRLPDGVQKKYTPIDIIQMYKYREVNVDTNVFIGSQQLGQIEYSYFIGIVDRTINRLIVTLDFDNILYMFKVGSLFFISINGFVALLIGYLFSSRLSKPLNLIIEGVRGLAGKKYDIHYAVKGIYKDVFHNVNLLSQQLKATEADRRRLDQMREEWLGNISHDIKTPLASIQGYAELMADPNYQFTNEEIHEYAHIIQKKSLYMKEVMEDLSLTTRLRNKQLILHKKRVNLVRLLRDVVIDILNDPQYAERHIELKCDEKRIDMEIDETLLRRAFNNLIFNAIVHNSPDTHIIVSIQHDDKMLITIEDNGYGIPKEELDKLFDRYYRGTNTGELHKGSGLGMAIANDAIAAHGGQIEITSEVGSGTKIEVRL